MQDVKEVVGGFVDEDEEPQEEVETPTTEPRPSTGQDGVDERYKLKHNWDGVTFPDIEAIGASFLKLLEEVKNKDSARVVISPFVLDATWDQDDVDLLHIDLEILPGCRIFPDPEEDDEGPPAY